MLRCLIVKGFRTVCSDYRFWVLYCIHVMPNARHRKARYWNVSLVSQRLYLQRKTYPSTCNPQTTSIFKIMMKHSTLQGFNTKQSNKKATEKKKKHPEAKTKECWCYCCCLRRGDGTQLLHLWPSNPEQRTCKPIPKKPTHMNVKWIQSDAKPTEFMKPVKVRWTTVYQKNQGTSLKTHAVHDGATFFGLTCCSCAKSKPLLFFW